MSTWLLKKVQTSSRLHILHYIEKAGSGRKRAVLCQSQSEISLFIYDHLRGNELEGVFELPFNCGK
jgi:hypothetical protein